MPVARLALAGAAAALVLTGCGQPDAANDNTNPLPDDRPQTQPTIIRTPVKVSEAPRTVPLPGPTGGQQGEPPEGGSEGDSEHGPDGT
ncbi:MAG TPA: hypothetical protein VNU26_12225 [Mycobacteriales bacterium]|nr:hypothetical protein [Mycobacteriales bacterium]